MGCISNGKSYCGKPCRQTEGAFGSPYFEEVSQGFHQSRNMLLGFHNFLSLPEKGRPEKNVGADNHSADSGKEFLDFSHVNIPLGCISKVFPLQYP